jgi:hypothetical protein
MRNKMRLLKSKAIFVFLLCLNIKGFAHSPDLSSLMIYEQNGKHYLAIRSSLTAFEGEVDYHFTKNGYKTPEEFQQLVINLFQKKCTLIINNDTIKFVQPSVVLGHETTLFSELPNVPNKINTLYLKNELFADFTSNLCELILTLKGAPQKQCILGNTNGHEVSLLMESGNWAEVKIHKSFFKAPNRIVFGVLFFAVVIGAGWAGSVQYSSLKI